MKNAEWMIKQGKNFSELTCRVNFVTDKFEICLDSKIIGEIGISTISKNPVLVWLDMEHVEPILDDAEKRYLKGVIRPFRNQIISIYKEQFGFNHESIIIEYYDFDRSQSTLCLPQFKKGSMYAGMKTGWRYTLEDLGL